MSFRLGVDIGGTFTDLVLAGPDGVFWTRKVSSTPDDYARGILEGSLALLKDVRVSPADVQMVVHGTTVATNAIAELRGARTALITTKGFRDVLELRRLRTPELYSLFYSPPRPLAERRLRLEVDERIGAQGEVVRPLDESTVHAAIDRIAKEGAAAVAVCLLHSYRNPSHERRVGEIVRKRLPDIHLSLSVDVLPEIREYERTSTTVVNAYIGPLVGTYLTSLTHRLVEAGIRAPLHIMQSNGGIMSARAAAATPAWIVESGPAAGVVGAHEAALKSGLRDIISFDMGGTTAKASIVERGERSWTTEYEVGGGISLSSRLIKGRGYALKLPVIDIAEVGAGGGSIVWIDAGGALKIGPRSAGAVPGPVCYGAGGEEPTVTDANLVLGYISPDQLAGGSVKLQADLARRSLGDRIAKRLGLGLVEAAYGVHAVANETMIRALKAVSTYRGRDPRDFVLFAFGGNGGIHGPGIARSLGMRTVIVPPAPGVFSAVGLLKAEPEYHVGQTVFGEAATIDPASLAAAYDDLQRRAVDAATAEGAVPGSVVLARQADLRYTGQRYELTVEGPPSGPISRGEIATVVDRFHAEHLRTYGHNAPGEAVEFVNLRVTARVTSGVATELRQSESTGPTGTTGATRATGATGATGGRSPSRQVHFGPQNGTVDTRVLSSRFDLGKGRQAGPLVIEEYDATTIVPPGATARLDDRQNIVIDL
jgi:N-methylhydantoinase A